MRNVFAAISLSIGLIAASQQQPGLLQTKAERFLFGPNIDSAVYYYTILENNFPDYQSGYIKSQIGYCYYNLNNLQKANEYFLKVLSLHESINTFFFDISQIAYALHQVYFRTGEFEKSLFYLLSTRTTYKPKMRSCTGGFGFYSEMKFAYDQALCYQGLKLTDSIVSILAPWVFKPSSRGWMLDSSTYRFASELFVASASKMYGKENLQCLLRNAIENSSYTIRFEKGNGNFQFAYVGCRFNFFNTTVPLTSGGIGIRPGEDLPSYLKKDFLIAEAKRSYTYELIMNDKQVLHNDSYSL